MKTDNKRKKLKKLLALVIFAIATVGLVLGLVFLIDWDTQPGQSGQQGWGDHVHGDGCAH
ncbi:MAG: hypothetical protein FWD35_04705 [Oscillospiraceae bacterium]|nr:hypothetical protein [Oscillospiraceae bacterium]